MPSRSNNDREAVQSNGAIGGFDMTWRDSPRRPASGRHGRLSNPVEIPALLSHSEGGRVP
jgi:hypothetical protein